MTKIILNDFNQLHDEGENINYVTHLDLHLTVKFFDSTTLYCWLNVNV